MAFGYTGTMRARPGRRDEVVAPLTRDIEELRPAGCRVYSVGVSAEDADLIHVHAVWDTKAQHDDSLHLPSMKAAIAEAMPMLTGEFAGVELTVVGGLGV
uniref:ABM domain-containing protein n=1 Tax=uncultured Nocardioidaceae bacterium TaxID=253824 RepID=A0A6J4MBA0_9ACTN|nr:MAG: hypothetical protein AVDCRST_MAG46-2800 [uncultured Nocardioidaceae bacterium]